ncbi:exported hypothetical protein [Capnocytophaga canimorsus]|uniref:Uncharacterized protein n=1 Tax=Capnocytophaga canimorsus TaxID=28188 RepID=A0A0B7HBC1_9FLAO|nr:hypothetical protein [Capnocytophaga canimorsus]CEN34918.1 exported hypothetical protein [Capnocytophaga canimorsus]
MKKILSLFIFVFATIYAHAQCEDHILETLKQTKVSYFQYVSEGGNANIYISYPFAGTTYKAIDDATGTEYTAVNSPLVNTMVIPVGVVNSARTFTLKMENGTCSVTHSEKPYIRPHAAPYLAIRMQNEWCASSGAIFFEMIGTGVNASDYNYYIKKENETHYNPTLLNPSEGVTNLISEKYIVKAVLKNPPHTQYEQAGNILPVDRKIEFDLKTFGGICDNRPSIKVNVKKGAYPLWYSVYDKTGTTLIRPDQLSPVFEGLDPKNGIQSFCKRLLFRGRWKCRK